MGRLDAHGALDALLQGWGPAWPLPGSTVAASGADSDTDAAAPAAQDDARLRERLQAFVDAQGRPMWATEAQREALLALLKQDPSMTPASLRHLQDMARLAGDVYSLPKDGDAPPEGFERVDPSTLGLDPALFDDPTTGFHAELYKDTRTGGYTLAFRGSDDKGADWRHGNIQAIDPKAPQYQQAIDLAVQLQQRLGDRFTHITGQSLGGGLAAAASVMTGVQATTFNAAGLNPATITSRGGRWDEARMRELITNVRVEGDPLTEAQEGSGIDPLSAWVSSHVGGWGAGLIGDLGEHLGSTASGGTQVSYLTGPAAQALPDAVGRQLTLYAFSEHDGHHLSTREQRHAGTWTWLHGFGAIGAGLLMAPGNPGPVNEDSWDAPPPSSKDGSLAPLTDAVPRRR